MCNDFSRNSSLGPIFETGGIVNRSDSTEDFIMEKTYYAVSPSDGEQWETKDFDIARTAFEKGCQVVEFKEYTTYSEFSAVRLIVST